MDDQVRDWALSVHDAVAKIVAMLDNSGGAMPSERIVSDLEAEGVDAVAASTAVAYAMQQGTVDLDWAFNVSRRVGQVQPA